MKPGIAAWLDGNMVDWTEIHVSPLSHAFNRASAVFEVMSVVETSRGPAVFCLDDHVDRFFSSAGHAFMNLPFSTRHIHEAVLATTRANDVRSGIVKCYAFHPDIDLGPVTPREISVAVFCLDYRALGVVHDKYARPVRIGISSYRKLHPLTAPVHAKITGNYSNGFLARMEARRRGFDDALMLDTEGFIAEAPTANVFFVTGRTVVTPPSDRVLPGITRRVVLDVLDDMGATVRQECIPPSALETFDEAFLSGTLRHVQPISAVEGRTFTSPGPLTSSLMERMEEIYSGTSKRYRDRLTFI